MEGGGGEDRGPGVVSVLVEKEEPYTPRGKYDREGPWNWLMRG